MKYIVSLLLGIAAYTAAHIVLMKKSGDLKRTVIKSSAIALTLAAGVLILYPSNGEIEIASSDAKTPEVVADKEDNKFSLFNREDKKSDNKKSDKDVSGKEELKEDGDSSLSLFNISKKSDKESPDKKDSSASNSSANAVANNTSKKSSSSQSSDGSSKSQSNSSKPQSSGGSTKPSDKVEYKTVRGAERVIPFKKVERKVDFRDKGTSQVVQKGVNGLEQDVYKVKYVNGKEVSREKTGTELIQGPVDQITEVGTKAVPQSAHNKAAAREAFNAVNAHRRANGIPELRWNETLYNAAAVRAKETERSFSHTRPNGAGYTSAIREAGFSGRFNSGENIVLAWSGQGAVNSWKGSSGHNENMLYDEFQEAAVGMYGNSETGYYTVLLLFTQY